MEQRNFVLFLTCSFAILFGWWTFVAPLLMPPADPAQVDGNLQDEAAVADASIADQTTEGDGTDAPADAGNPAVAEAQPSDSGSPADNTAGYEPDLADHPPVTLGSLDPESGYFLQAKCSRQGASILSVQLSDNRYRELTDQELSLQVIGNNISRDRTLATSSAEIDRQLEPFGTSLARVNWEVAGETRDAALPNVNSSVEFRFVSPDGTIEIRKRYTVKPSQARGSELAAARNSDPTGYQIDMTLTLVNRGPKPQALSYGLQGPVGVKLENEEHTRKFRDVKIGFLDEGEIRAETMTASDIYEQHLEEVEKGLDRDAANLKLEEWKNAFKYIGVDVQFFAAILVPLDDRPVEEIETTPWIQVARPMLVQGNDKQKTWSDISVVLESRDIDLAPGAEATHAYTLYTGPKREDLLSPEPIGASDVLDYGFFGPVASIMLSILGFIHDLGAPYGLSIICLTVMVRGLMYPISRKQAMGAKKMKELQPELAQLKAKYGEDRERMAREQMELFRRHNYNPLAGCLPVFLQLPIFIGLYTALNASVDLRLAGFLWIDNLAAPDALFRMPVSIPFLGQDFNILPVVTITLFIVQQKMFMPPPTDEQQAMQQKMMNYMMIVFGVMFWHVPAGLCVYFIASSLWGLCERKILDWKKDDEPSAPAAEPDKGDDPRGGGGSPNGRKPDPKPKVPGFMERLLEAAQAANESATQSGARDSQQPRKQRKKKKTKKYK